MLLQLQLCCAFGVEPVLLACSVSGIVGGDGDGELGVSCGELSECGIVARGAQETVQVRFADSC